MGDLRVEMKFKNGVLFNAMKDFYGELPMKEWAEKSGIHYQRLVNLLCMAVSPFDGKYGTGKATSKYTRTAHKLSDVLAISPEELFPESLYRLKLPKKYVKEFDSIQILSLQEARQQGLLPPPESYEMTPPEEGIAAILKTLTEREEKIIRMRFGFDGEEKTLKECGAIWGVQPERIRQIEKKALRKLRHFSKLGRKGI